MNPHRDEIVDKVSPLLLTELYDLPTQAAKVYCRQLSVDIYNAIFGAIPEYDNHHNALMCPYCNRRRDERERKLLDQFSARVITKLGSDLEASAIVTQTLISFSKENYGNNTKRDT